MSAKRASGWMLGLGLLVWVPAETALADTALDLPTLDLPAAIPDLVEPQFVATAEPADPATEAETSAADLNLPEPPSAPVEMPVVAAAQTPAPAPGDGEVDLPSALPPAAVVIAAADVLPAAVQLRLSDPKLALPPKLSRKDRDALTAFYAAGGHGALWVDDGGWTPRAKALSETLANAQVEGLDPADYPVPRLDPEAPSVADLAEAELKLSAAAFLYARDARGGRIDPSKISGYITPKLDLPALDAVLATLKGSEAPGEALAGLNPAYPGYRALRAKLADLRASRPSGTVYSPPTVQTPVRQAARQPTGRVATDVPVPGAAKAGSARLEGDVIANMERWRWLPAEVGRNYVVVNIPEFRLRLFQSGRITHEARVATGTVGTQTPVFSDVIQYAVVNPSWYVPPSIMRQHAAAIASDPTYASRAGVSIIRAGRAVTYRMPPGPNNPLGNIKYMFPNGHAVYLHDTNGRSIFGATQRALSHGCVRLENPFAFGGKIMGGDWSEQRLKSLVGHGERQILLADKLPIHLSYFTVWVDEAGEVHQFGDVYGHHRRVRMALGLGA